MWKGSTEYYARTHFAQQIEQVHWSLCLVLSYYSSCIREDVWFFKHIPGAQRGNPKPAKQLQVLDFYHPSFQVFSFSLYKNS
jgi:hypothetical protein